jgi:hypothetical protein
MADQLRCSLSVHGVLSCQGARLLTGAARYDVGDAVAVIKSSAAPIAAL